MLKLFLEDPDNWEYEIDELAAECYPEIEYEWVDVHGIFADDPDTSEPATV